MTKSHVCDEIMAEEERDREIEISLTQNGDDPWHLYLFDGDGVGTRVSFCPYCGEKLN